MKYLDLASTRFRIHSVSKNNISTLESGFFKKVADSYVGFTEYVWFEADTGKKKLRSGLKNIRIRVDGALIKALHLLLD